MMILDQIQINISEDDNISLDIIPSIIDLDVSDDNLEIEMEQAVVINPYSTYTGTYDVTPLITSQILYTNEKLMMDDVRVDMIPTREEYNAQGGVTFIVGE